MSLESPTTSSMTLPKSGSAARTRAITRCMHFSRAITSSRVSSRCLVGEESMKRFLIRRGVSIRSWLKLSNNACSSRILPAYRNLLSNTPALFFLFQVHLRHCRGCRMWLIWWLSPLGNTASKSPRSNGFMSTFPR